MSANDPGHINNLDKNQEEALKKFWICLLDKITLPSETNLKNEFFNAIGCDNPDVVLLRWLRAKKWDIDNALEQFLDTLKWRIEWGVSQLIANGESDLCYDEIIIGKTVYIGYDKEGRPINYVPVKDHIKGQFTSEQTEKLTVFAMEIGRKLLKNGNESVTILFDMEGFSMKNMDYQHTKFLIQLLENYYPESLALALVINASWLFNSCWFIIKPWVDPIVQSKIRFIKTIDDLNEFIDLSNLPKRLNGDLPDFNYIPPTEQDQLILKTIREDTLGKTQAIENHQQASQNYLRITLEWTRQNDQNSLIEERKKATKQLTNTYEQLIPYISTKTHYHRNGFIHEPTFDITFQNIQQNIARF